MEESKTNQSKVQKVELTAEESIILSRSIDHQIATLTKAVDAESNEEKRVVIRMEILKRYNIQNKINP